MADDFARNTLDNVGFASYVGVLRSTYKLVIPNKSHTAL